MPPTSLQPHEVKDKLIFGPFRQPSINIQFLTSTPSSDDVWDVMEQIEKRYGVDVDYLSMPNSPVFAHLRKNFRTELDMETRTKLLYEGWFATFYGRPILITKASRVVFLDRTGDAWELGIGKPLTCSRCGGSGSVGAISYIRCPDC